MGPGRREVGRAVEGFDRSEATFGVLEANHPMPILLSVQQKNQWDGAIGGSELHGLLQLFVADVVVFSRLDDLMEECSRFTNIVLACTYVCLLAKSIL